MLETMVNVKEIFEKYGLQAEEIEPAVYEVLNNDKKVSISELQWEFDKCVMITSNELGYKKLDMGINAIISYIYYIILDYDNKELVYKYHDIAAEKFGKTLVMPYKHNHAPCYGIDTIYAEEEI